MKVLLFTLAASALILQSCGSSTQSAIETGIAQTEQISALETAAASGGGLAQVQPTVEPGQPGDMPGPSVPFVSVSQSTNCRSGPRLDYTLLTTINVGQQVEVLKTFSNDYVLVKNPNGSGDCWLFLQFADTTDFSAFNLAVATQPPTPTATNTPTPEFNWGGNWVLYLFDETYNVNINQSGNSISGSIVDLSFSIYDHVTSLQPWSNISFEYGGYWTLYFNGSLSENRQVATGTWKLAADPNEPPLENGSFQWQINASNTNQFIGNLDGTDAWCGSRSGAPMPNPCFGP